jgi:hypothetical protein
MQFYNRLTGQTRQEMPTRLWLGQWQIHTETETATINAVPISPQSRLYIFPDTGKRCLIRVLDESRKEQSFPDWQIPSDLLLESLGFFAGTLDKLDHLSGNLWEEWVNTSPLVHDIGKTIRPQKLEELLERHIGHIEEICHRPRTYLKMETDRLPVSRVQRISPHATEFLSAHTEDWEKRTFRNVRPKRVLCLIREDLLDIYENKVTARLIDHLLEYLQKRIIEVKALKRELEQADDFSQDTQKIHWRNRNRICSLWGDQFQAGTALKTAEKTLKLLKQLQYKLRGLLDTELYRAIPKQANVGNTLKRTNILIDDQHYRYVDRLWQAWMPWKRGHTQSPQQIFETYKQGFKGFEAFCLLLVSRALTGNGTTNDRGLEFKADDLLCLQPDASIQFHSLRGSITLRWQHDGTILLDADKIQHLKLIPLMLPLTATEDANVINPLLDEFRSACSENQNGTVIILYPGTEDERQKLPQLLQQEINSLKKPLAVLPVSPLDILSVERIARAIQWWLYSQYCQIYPFTIQEKIPASLLEQNSWIFKEGRHYKLLCSPKPEEQVDFDNRLSELINEAKSRGPRARGELFELQNLNNFSARTKERFKPLLTCPTCYKKSDHFEPLDSQCFRCYCKSGNDDCGTEWGMRICGKCSERYPYIKLSDLDILNSWYDRQLGSVDRIFGRNVLAIPCRSDKDTRSFICPACGACS